MGEKHDCKAYKLNKDNPKIKETIDLQPDKRYIVAFINKTRNDSGDNQILYQWDGVWNYWKEIGFCHISNNHMGG